MPCWGRVEVWKPNLTPLVEERHRAWNEEVSEGCGMRHTFRKFIRDELMPEIRGRYRTTAETAIVGESLAGLFVVETFLLEPEYA